LIHKFIVPWSAAREVAGTTGGFWFDRRPHIIVVRTGTRSTPNEVKQLVKELENISGIEVIK
jgi:hypothetical protein